MHNCSAMPDEYREMLRRWMQAVLDHTGWSAKEWARRADTSPTNITRLTNSNEGSTPNFSTVMKLMKVAPTMPGVSPDNSANNVVQFPFILNESTKAHDEFTPVEVETAFIIGEVRAGQWLEDIEWTREEWMPIVAPADPRYQHLKQFGLLVRGPSMNEFYQDGDVVICVKLIDLGRDPDSEDHVVAHRVRRDGLTEATVKEYREIEGRKLLMPRSTHPDHQAPVDITDPGDGNQDEEICMTALVIGSFHPRKPLRPIFR